jgi:hypothetical protein
MKPLHVSPNVLIRPPTVELLVLGPAAAGRCASWPSARDIPGESHELPGLSTPSVGQWLLIEGDVPKLDGEGMEREKTQV